MRIPRLLTLAMLLAAGGLALAQEIPGQGQPAGYGVSVPSGSKLTTTLGNDLDVDDYVFRGYPGQQLKTSIKVDKSSAVKMQIELIRPDGTRVTADDEGAKFKTGETLTDFARYEKPDSNPPYEDRPIGEVLQATKIKYVLDQVGTWKIRVRAPELSVPFGDSGEYTLAVKYPAPPKTKIKNSDPTQPQIYTFAVPAEGGSTVDFKFKFKGGEAAFNGFRAPNGDFIDIEVQSKPGKYIKGKKIVLPDGFPVGDYLLTFAYPEGATFSKTVFKSSVKLPQGAKKRKGRLASQEPQISSTGINPEVGGPPTIVTVTILNGYDPPNDANAIPELLLDNRPLTIQTAIDNGSSVTLKALVGSLGEGTFDVVTRTKTGQVAVLEGGFTRVPPPVATAIDPLVGSSAGGFDVVIQGTGFPADITKIGILIDGNDVPVQKISASSTEVRFVAPPRAPTFVTFGIRDLRSQLSASLPINSFEYLSSPGISRIVPGLVPILGGDTLFVKGTNFRETDTVFMETAVAGQYEQVAGPTYIDHNLHSFIAPVRPKGRYQIYVKDNQNVETPKRSVSYFQYADFTGDAGMDNPPSADLNDGWTTALSDFDRDGDTDLFIAKRGDPLAMSSAALISVFTNDGSGNLTKSTERIPSPTSNDDWRADRIQVVDVTQDGWPDIVITTDDKNVLTPSASHTRILTSTRRGAQTPNSDRIFVDRTLDLMATPRNGTGGVSNASGDNWRGLDLWVGDVDSGPAAPPEIIITHKDMKEELNIFCGNYCNTSTTGGYTYSFYWGGSRAFTWDPKARGGQGRYKFEHNFFPRKAGVTVPVFNPPPGVVIPTCTTNECRGTFTPFIGQLLRVQDISADGRPDVVVISDGEVKANGQTISSTQVGLFGFSAVTGSFVTDITSTLTALGGQTRADSATIGLFGYPDGNSFGTIVLGQAEATSGRAIRLLQFQPGVVEGDPGSFADVTAQTIPPASGNEAWQASAMQVADVDTDGDPDLILVAKEAPGPGEPAFRILRNTIANNQIGILSPEFSGLIELIAGGSEPFDGGVLVIGDLDGDGGNEFVVTRTESTQTGPQTRIIATDQ